MNDHNTSYDNLSKKTAPGVPEEEKINSGHIKTRKKLRVAGIICIIVGLPLSCVGIGLPIVGVGLMLLLLGYAGKMARYQAAEMAPVQKDTFNYVADGTQQGVKTVTKAAGEGLASGFAAGGMAGIGAAGADAQPGVRCYKCNYVETADAKFCSSCGAAMEKSKPCPQCKELNDPDAKFCDNCGQSL